MLYHVIVHCALWAVCRRYVGILGRRGPVSRHAKVIRLTGWQCLSLPEKGCNSGTYASCQAAVAVKMHSIPFSVWFKSCKNVRGAGKTLALYVSLQLRSVLHTVGKPAAADPAAPPSQSAHQHQPMLPQPPSSVCQSSLICLP